MVSGVIGLSTSTVSETELPFSTSGGRSSFTLPFVTGASPTTLRIAACIDAGVAARAGRSGSRSRRRRPARPCRSESGAGRLERVIIARHGFAQSRSVTRYATTSSICSAVSIGLPAKRGRHARQTIDTIIGRHDRLRVEPAGIHDPQPQLALGPTRAPAPFRSGARCPGTAPPERARCGRAGKAHLPVSDNAAPAFRIAVRAGQRLGMASPTTV